MRAGLFSLNDRQWACIAHYSALQCGVRWRDCSPAHSLLRHNQRLFPGALRRAMPAYMNDAANPMPIRHCGHRLWSLEKGPDGRQSRHAGFPLHALDRVVLIGSAPWKGGAFQWV